MRLQETHERTASGNPLRPGAGECAQARCCGEPTFVKLAVVVGVPGRGWQSRLVRRVRWTRAIQSRPHNFCGSRPAANQLNEAAAAAHLRQ